MKQLFILIFFSIFALDVFAQLRPSESQYFVEKGVLINPSFEQGYQGWVITGCTKSLVSETPYLNKSLKLICTNETFSIKQVSTALTSFSKQQGAFDLQIKTTASGVNVSSITNGVRDNAYSVINSIEFKRFKEIGFIVGDTDNGIEVYSDANFTGEIVLDNVKLGLGNLMQGQTTKCQTKLLDADVISNGIYMSFNNLDTSKIYSLSGTLVHATGAVTVIENSGLPEIGYYANSTGGDLSVGVTVDVFSPTSTTLNIRRASGGTIFSSAARNRTNFTLCELPDTVIETTEFN